MSPPINTALSGLMLPLSEAEFCEKHWPDHHAVVHGPRDRLPDLFQNPILANAPTLFANYRGRTAFSKGTTGPRSYVVQQVDPAILFGMGLSLYLPDLESVLPEAPAFLRALELALGIGPGTARITAWASPKGEKITCHYDAEEVISIQLQGHKRFSFAPQKALESPVGAQFGLCSVPVEDLYPQVGQGFPDPKDFVFEDVEMLPGSLLFLPRGTWHHTASEEDSLSITIVLSPPSAMEQLLPVIRSLLLQDTAWRRPQYAGRADMDERLASLVSAVKQLRPEHLLPRLTLEQVGTFQSEFRFQKNPGWLLKHQLENGVLTINPIPGPAYEPVIGIFEAQVPIHLEGLVAWIEGEAKSFTFGFLCRAFDNLLNEEVEQLLRYLAGVGYIQYLNFPRLDYGAGPIT